MVDETSRRLAGDEVDRLLTPVAPLGLPVPAYGGRSLPNLTRSVVEATSRPVEGDPPLVPSLEPAVDPFHGRRAEGPVVVLLVDGFGWYPFARWAESGSSAFAREWSRRARPITTVFPTTIR